MHLGRVVCVIAACVLLFPATISAQSQGPRIITTDELRQTKNGGNDWITYGGANNNQRYSTLDQINTGNVSQLKGSWLSRLGSARGSKYRFEADPLVIDGVMYIPTGNDDIFALNAKTGQKIWSWESDIPQVNDLVCCGWDNRGVAVADGMVFSGLLDASFVALDQKTGKQLWRTQLEDYHNGYSITGAFRYFDGLVFTGMSGGENGVRGRVYALDAKTGREVWRFYTVPGPGDIGGDSWPANSDIFTHGGATVWQAVSVDPELGAIYFSTGNAGPWDGALRPGDSLFSSSIVALDYKTGQYKWHFQQVHHDIWDYDNPSPTVLFDTVQNGQPRKALVECAKTNWCYFLDRTNGTPLIGIEEKPVPQEPRQFTAATQPYPVGDAVAEQCGEPAEGFPLVACIYDTYWDVPVVFRPLGSGGVNWNPPSYSPKTEMLYVTANNQNSAIAIRDVPYEQGRRWTRVATTTPIGVSISSTLTALDAHTNKIVWQKKLPFESIKGLATTAGGILFGGQADGNFKAWNAATGEELWSFQVGWGIGAPPMTYSVDGVQYVAVAAGGNRGGITTTDGDAVWAFALNGNIDEVAAAPKPLSQTAFTGRIVTLGDTLAGPGTIYDDVVFDGTLLMDDYFFSANRVQVPVGTTITWQNRGATVHTATENKGSWDTGDVLAGESRSVTFDTPGTYTYTCSPHPWMLGQVIVQ